MPKLHIIYDPTDRLITTSEFNERLKIKVAVLSVSEDLETEGIRETAEQLTILLLNAVYK